MNFQLKHRGMDCPEDLEATIREKTARFERLLPDNSYMEVELVQYAKTDGTGDKEAEVILDLPGVKPVIRFASHGNTFLEAVDRVFDKLDEELSKRKDRRNGHHHGTPPKERLAAEMHRTEIAP